MSFCLNINQRMQVHAKDWDLCDKVQFCGSSTCQCSIYVQNLFPYIKLHRALREVLAIFLLLLFTNSEWDISMFNISG